MASATTSPDAKQPKCRVSARSSQLAGLLEPLVGVAQGFLQRSRVVSQFGVGAGVTDLAMIAQHAQRIRSKTKVAAAKAGPRSRRMAPPRAPATWARPCAGPWRPILGSRGGPARPATASGRRGGSALPCGRDTRLPEPRRLRRARQPSRNQRRPPARGNGREQDRAAPRPWPRA